MRTAVVDIGSNTTRLYIADVEDGRITDELERRTKVTRLGAGVDKDGRLSDEAMQRVYETLDTYKQLIDQHGVERAVAVLTSATRDAANGPEFAATVRDRYELEPHVLKGEEEARLSFLGATSDRDPGSATPTLVIDIGGGSTELIIGRGPDRRVLRLDPGRRRAPDRAASRFRSADGGRARRRVGRRARTFSRPRSRRQHRRAVEHAIAVAGTATSLAAIAQDLDPYDPSRVHGYVLEGDERDRLAKRLAAMTLEERRHVKGLDPARAPSIVAGTVILTEVMHLFGLEHVEVSEHDILRGAALGL